MDMQMDTSERTIDTNAAVAITGSGPDHDRRVTDLLELMDVIRPAVEADGGTLHLKAVDTDTGDVTVELAGACGSCVVASLTLEGGITRILQQRLDWITEVHGEVEADPDAVGWGGWTPTTR